MIFSAEIARAGRSFLVMGCMGCLSALAATTGEITITGNVPILCSLEVRQEAGAVNIPDISAGHAGLRVATVIENCKSLDGYTVTMLGANSSNHTGMFVDQVSLDSHPFSIAYDGIPVSPGGVVTNSSLTAFNLAKTVDITYPADATLIGTLSDSYEETLVFIIAAK